MTLREKNTLWACFHLFEIKFVWLILRFIQLIVSSANQLDVFPNQKYIVGIMKTQPRKLRILGNSYARCPQGAANTRKRRWPVCGYQREGKATAACRVPWCDARLSRDSMDECTESSRKKSACVGDWRARCAHYVENLNKKSHCKTTALGERRYMYTALNQGRHSS